MIQKILLSILGLLVLISACAVDAPSPTPTSSRPWTEQQVTFNFDQDELFGILTLPTSDGPYPAIVIVSGSVSVSTGHRDGVNTPYFKDHGRNLVLNGFAVLRYDPPGVGQSTGDIGFEPLDRRAAEAVAAVQYLQSRPDIQSDKVGLWGISQGGWIIAMAAASSPEDVAFIIPVSGSGVSVAEQQVYSIEAQSINARMSDEDITKAVLFGRMLIDWQLVDPIFREANTLEAEILGEGPWTSFMELIYEPGEITPAMGLEKGIEILKSIQDEPWAEFLYIKKLYLPTMESIPPDQVAALKAVVGPTLLNDPQEYMTRLRSPVLAIFGENDLLQPTEKSAALYEQHLTEAGNENFKIVVLPGVGHAIPLTSDYWNILSDWLADLYSE